MGDGPTVNQQCGHPPAALVFLGDFVLYRGAFAQDTIARQEIRPYLRRSS
jgi:hypothetical protein